MTNPVFNQNGFGFYDNDSNWNFVSGLSENDNLTATDATTVILRLEVEITNAKAVNNYVPVIRAAKNGGSYADLTTGRTDGLRIATDGWFTDADADNNDRLTSSSLTFTGGELDEDGTLGETVDGMDFVGEDHWEIGIAIEIDTGNASDNDYWDIELYKDDGTTPLDGYSRIPRITYEEGVTDNSVSGISDSVTVGDTASMAALTLPNLEESDSVTVGDSPTMYLGLGDITESDAVTVGDTASLESEDLAVSESDAVTVGESDNITGLEAQDLNITGISESITVTDTLPTGYYYEISVGEDVTVEVVTPEVEPEISESDPVSVGDTATIGALELGDVAESDAITVGDTASLYMGLEVSESESITLGDTEGITLTIEIAESESVTIGDTEDVNPVYDLNIAESESVTVSDSPTAQVTTIGEWYVSQSDPINVSDSPTLTLQLADVSESDAVSVTDTPQVSVSSIGAIDVNVSDSISVTDIPTFDPLAITVSESDAVTAGDTPVIYFGLNISESDGISITDTVGFDSLEIKFAVSDAVALADSPNVVTAIAGVVYTIAVDDSVSVSDNAIVYCPSRRPSIWKIGRAIRRETTGQRYNKLNRYG